MYRSFEIMLLADARLACSTCGIACRNFLMSNGLKSPADIVSAANTGITGVPNALFFNKAISYLVCVKLEF